MKIFKLGDIRLDEKEFQTDLGENNFIFIGSSCDMFANNIPFEWIIKIFNHCKSFKKNRYLFQSKNPQKIFEMKQYLPENIVIGTTIETNRFYSAMGNAPSIASRKHYLTLLKQAGFETMLTVEPIMDFDLDDLVKIIKSCEPSWVNIGADSKGHNLIEPDKIKILKLIAELEIFTDVKQKINLKRLLK